MLEKIDKIQALLNVPNVDKDSKTAIANMKILNLLVDLRSEAEQLILSGVVKSLPIQALPNCTRVEVIDQKGRSYVNWKPTNKTELSLQDNGKTLKVFISN
jgi:hypothetical protein